MVENDVLPVEVQDGLLLLPETLDGLREGSCMANSGKRHRLGIVLYSPGMK